MVAYLRNCALITLQVLVSGAILFGQNSSKDITAEIISNIKQNEDLYNNRA